MFELLVFFAAMMLLLAIGGYIVERIDWERGDESVTDDDSFWKDA
jgi:hypothetical protein